jgi:hypothetical protein
LAGRRGGTGLQRIFHLLGRCDSGKDKGEEIMLEVFIAAGIAFGILGIFFYKILTREKKA